MKIQKNSNLRKKFIIIVILLGLISLGGFYFYKVDTNKPNLSDTSVDYSGPSDGQINIGKEAKDRTIAESQKEQTASSEDSAFDHVISTLTIEDDILYVRNEINLLTNQGECTIKISNGTDSIEKKSAIQPLAQTSTCKGFNIPVKELTKGEWQVELVVTIDSKNIMRSDTVEI